MAAFKYTSPAELTILANIIALAIAEGKTAEEVNVLGNLITAVGGLLLTYAAQQQTIKDISTNTNTPKTIG